MKTTLLAIAAAFALYACSSKNQSATTTNITDVPATTVTDAAANHATNTPTPTPAAALTGAEYQQKLQGKWEAIDDAKAIVEFAGNKRIEYYGKDKMTEATFSMAKSCDAAPADPSASEAYLKTSDDFCYYILNIDDNTLELSYVERGNTLTYTKVK